MPHPQNFSLCLLLKWLSISCLILKKQTCNIPVFCKVYVGNFNVFLDKIIVCSFQLLNLNNQFSAIKVIAILIQHAYIHPFSILQLSHLYLFTSTTFNILPCNLLSCNEETFTTTCTCREKKLTRLCNVNCLWGGRHMHRINTNLLRIFTNNFSWIVGFGNSG